MRIRQEADIHQIEELDYRRGNSSGTATARLMARIARRPGRWRQSMRRAKYDEERSYEEAA